MLLRRIRRFSPGRFKARTVFILWLMLIFLAIFVAYTVVQTLRFSHVRKTFGLTKIKLPKVRGQLFARTPQNDDDDGNEFMDLVRMGKEPKWEIPEVFRQVPGMKKPALPVVIVEEHYEVLKYWFDAVETGIIPKRGNTLIHIDGHSDGAPPRDPHIVPWFHLPKNHSEVANMMQSNDVFIAGAGLTGLINRFIWIWPDWDRAEHKKESDHQINDVIAGWRTYYPRDREPFQRRCACIKPHNATDPTDWECWNDEPDSSEMGGGAMIQSMNCKPVLTGTTEFVHENRALELLKKGDWIKEHETIVLDIDEDYYGCESSVMPLYKAKFTRPTIEQISEIVHQFLCVNDVNSELIADKIFRTIVQIVRDFKVSLCKDPSSEDTVDCVSEFSADKAIILMISRILHSIKEADTEDLLCEKEWNSVRLQVLLRTLFSFSIEQLDALNYVGVCLVQAPTSMMFEPDSLHICHGFNTPGNTQVTFHVPTAVENDIRSELLKNTLVLLPQQPRLVTVCRSMRDGYTPWAFFTYIEKAILEALRSAFKDVREDSYHFDENLLGGKNGWPERHQN